VAAPHYLIENPILARVISVSGICLSMWFSEVLPPFVPTFLLWVLIPLFLSSQGSRFDLQHVLTWAADPVLALFLGGFALGLAAERSGMAFQLEKYILRFAKGSLRRLLLSAMICTAFLSMWLSNIAAAALVFACVKPLLNAIDEDSLARRGLLLAVAFGANIGGIATPIGTGPNAIAIAAISPNHPISFVTWMSFAFPLTVGMLLLAFALLILKIRNVPESFEAFALIGNEETAASGQKVNANEIKFLIIISATALLWLTEPLHSIAAPVVALAAAIALFISGTLKKSDLGQIDWSTLLLIAGGITLGRLLEQGEVVGLIAASFPIATLHPTLALFILCTVAAFLSALMSNTATVVLMIPLALSVVAGPSTAILMAIAASFGMPFIISTPPNAMAYGHGGLRSGDLFWPGIVLMVTGCVVVSLTGKQVLKFAGVP
jgi:sodium-dependent dicarboxylate transporter 2/3/5